MVSARDVEGAYERVRPLIGRTRLEKSQLLSRDGTEVYMKLESEQPQVRSYKLRGVLARLTLLSEEERKRDLAAISSGNHGVSLAYGARLLGLKAPLIYAPTSTPGPKKKKIASYGGELRLVGENFDRASELGEELIKSSGSIWVDSREDPRGVAGQGTVAVEIMEEVEDLDILLVPIGSGGLITGCASYLKERFPRVKVVGVEPDYCPAMSENLEKGRWTKFFPCQEETILDSLVGGIAHHSFERAGELIDEILLINDGDVKEALWDMLLEEKLVVEPDSAVSYAALKKYPEKFKGKKVAMIITGSNIENQLFKDIVREKLSPSNT